MVPGVMVAHPPCLHSFPHLLNNSYVSIFENFIHEYYKYIIFTTPSLPFQLLPCPSYSLSNL